MKIVKCHNLYIVVTKHLTTVFQTHVRANAEMYIREASDFHTMSWKISESNDLPVKYGRLCRY